MGDKKGNSMSNDEIGTLCQEVFLVFWAKWRDQGLPKDSPKWDEMVEEGRKIMEKYGSCRLVCDIVGDLIEILDQRMRKETEES